MRIVRLEHDVLDANAMTSHDRRWIIDCAEPEIPFEYIGGTRIPTKSVATSINDVVEPIKQHRHPADAALGHRDLQVRVLQRITGPQPFGTCRQ